MSACVHLIDPATAANTEIGLQVWAQVVPTEFSISDTVSRIRIRINAKNPGNDTILVENGGPACDKQPDPIDGVGLLFSMRIGDDNHLLDAGPGADPQVHPEKNAHLGFLRDDVVLESQRSSDRNAGIPGAEFLRRL
jgi:hypothetical protein